MNLTSRFLLLLIALLLLVLAVLWRTIYAHTLFTAVRMAPGKL